MIILIVLALLFIVGKAALKNNFWNEDAMAFLMLFSGIGFLTSILLVISLQCSDFSRVGDYHNLKNKIQYWHGKNMDEMTKYHLYVEIEKMDDEIATCQHWNDTIFDIWRSDTFAALPPLPLEF